MHRKLVLCLTIVLLASSCSKPSEKHGESELPESFDRSTFLSLHFSDLEDYCDLLEHLYSTPNSDTKVISEIERLIAKKTLLLRAIDLDVSELDSESTRGLLAVLRIAEVDVFGRAFDQPLLLRPNIDSLRKIHSRLEERQQYLQSHIRAD